MSGCGFWHGVVVCYRFFKFGFCCYSWLGSIASGGSSRSVVREGEWGLELLAVRNKPPSCCYCESLR